MKNAPPIRPTTKPKPTTNNRFFLPINGVKSAVENTKAIRIKNSTIIKITNSVSMVSSLDSQALSVNCQIFRNFCDLIIS